jgi:hypothetical protein
MSSVLRLLLSIWSLFIAGTVKAQCPFGRADGNHRTLYSEGSRSCVAGYPAVYARDGQGSPHTMGKRIVTGPLWFGDFDVKLGDKVLTTPKNDDFNKDNPPNEIDINEGGYRLYVTGKDEKKFLGFQIVLSSPNKGFDGTHLRPVRPFHFEGYRSITGTCSGPGGLTWAGVTHKSKVAKDGDLAFVKLDKDAPDTRLDVTILVAHTETYTEWYYSQFKIKPKVPPPPKKPPVNGTDVPTEMPTSSPAPVTVTLGPWPTTPIANPTFDPPNESPLPNAPMTRTTTLLPSSETIPSALPPSVAPPPPSPVAIPSAGPTRTASIFPSTTGSVSWSADPTSTVPPSMVGTSLSPAALPPPTAIVPTLFTTSSVASPESCLDRCNNGDNGDSGPATRLRNGCGPCPTTTNGFND